MLENFTKDKLEIGSEWKARNGNKAIIVKLHDDMFGTQHYDKDKNPVSYWHLEYETGKLHSSGMESEYDIVGPWDKDNEIFELDVTKEYITSNEFKAVYDNTQNSGHYFKLYDGNNNYVDVVCYDRDGLPSFDHDKNKGYDIIREWEETIDIGGDPNNISNTGNFETSGYIEDKFQIGQEWRTRDGNRAVIVKEFSDDSLYVYHEQEDKVIDHRPNGKTNKDTENLRDLVNLWLEEPIKFKKDICLNIYENTSDIYEDRKEAKDNRLDNILACITLTYTVGEGLD